MRDLKNIKRVIIKIGSSSLVKKDLSLNGEMFEDIFTALSKVRDAGVWPVIVTSGAVATGMHELGMKKKPKDMSVKQALAAVGQIRLMEEYNRYADKYGLKLGQILVSHDDFQVRKRMLCLTETFEAMYKNSIIPVINENDALAVEEISVGDNDTLSALVAPLVHADLLVLFSDIDGFYDKNPKQFEDAKLISEISEINDEILAKASGSDSLVGTGGMETKLHAAIISGYASSNMIICNADRMKDLYKIIKGEEIGSLFLAHPKEISGKDHWLIFNTNSQGAVLVDEGLCEALMKKRVSILPKGVIGVKGEFLKGNVIDVINKNGDTIAKGLVNFSSMEIKKLEGVKSELVESIVGYKCKNEIIHANDLVVLEKNYGKLR